MATTKFRLNHTPALDGLRGLAILAVVLFHSSWVSAGYMGVDVFFVLSGFLITCLLLQEWEDHGKIDIAAFYWRRALRLAPALIALILICSAYETLYPACGSSLPLWSRALYAISYFSNWLWALGGPVTASPLCSFYALWSLAIEEQFYLIWPLTLVGLLRRSISKRTLAFAICGVIVSLNAFRLYLWSSGAPYWRIYAGSDTHADPILIGCLLALGVFTLPRSYWRKIRSLVLCCGPLALAGVLILMLRLSFPSQSFFMFSSRRSER
jgi:peptidoglycan/LPS O-acetylase OafA/YrhL